MSPRVEKVAPASTRGTRGIIVLSALLMTTLSCAPPARVVKASTIILVIVDTLRADHLSCYGYRRPTTQSICALARDATIFERAYTPRTETTPAIASVMTGLYPYRHGVRNLYQVLPDSMQTLPELLGAAGYRTGGFVSSFVMVRDFSGFAQGFEIYDDRMTRRELNRENFERDAPSTVDHAIRWLRSVGGDPVFLFVHLIEPHGPYTPPEPFERQFALAPAPPLVPTMPAYQKIPGLRYVTEYVGRYDGEIAAADKQIKRLLGELRKLGRYDDATIIVTADHGESMGEEGHWFSHGLSVNDAEAWVPLLVKFGGAARPDRAGVRWGKPISLLDAFATIMASAGVKPPAEARAQSVDLRGVVDGSVPRNPPVTELVTGRGIVLSVHGESCAARWIIPRPALTAQQVLADAYRAADWPAFAHEDKKNERRADPQCVAALAKAAGTTVRDLLTYRRDFAVTRRTDVRLPGFRESFVAQQKDPFVPLTGEEAEKLRALGYAESGK